MKHLIGKFVWFEHVSGHGAKARKFYDPLFNWHTESMPMGGQRYHLILNGADGIGGYRSEPETERPYWLSHASVDDVDSSYRTALAAGARSIQPPADFGQQGRGAIVADPYGAVFGLWTSANEDRPDSATNATGDWCWNELWTPDEMGALAFYQRVLGYTHESMDLGPGGTYYLLKKDGMSRAGLMRSAEPKAQSMWLPYVAVAACDATADKARALGGQVLSPPTDIPGIGRFAVFADPVGAAIAVLEPLAEDGVAGETVSQATAA